MESYATLLNKKILIRSQKTDYVAVQWHFLVRNMQPQLERIYVEEEWYLERNPDVRIAIAENQCVNASDHYYRHGYFEHRMPYPILVDDPWYLNEYTDVGAAVGSGLFESGQMHFDALGFHEGRIPHPRFSLRLVDGPASSSA